MRETLQTSGRKNFTFIVVKDNEKMVKVQFNKIIFITAERSYCCIQTISKQYILTQPMSEVAEYLTGDEFIRVGRSNIINTDFFSYIIGLSIYFEVKNQQFSITIKNRAMTQLLDFFPLVGIRKRVLNKKKSSILL